MSARQHLPARFALAFLLAGVLAAGIWPAASAQENAGPATRRAQLAELAARFERDRALYMSERFSERETREQFLNEFFTILGWDVENRREVFLYQQDTIPEARLRLGDTMHYADYAFRVDARTRFYCEAKAAHRDIDDPDYIFQAKRYAWSSMRAELVILTDFETFRVYDCRSRPDVARPREGELERFHMSYADYARNFDLLWNTFSEPAVSGGAIGTLLERVEPPIRRIRADRAFIADLNDLRLLLGRDIYGRNAALSAGQLNEATQHVLNMLVFCRILEDRDIEPTGRLRERLDLWEIGPRDRPLFDHLQDEFERLRRRYRGVVFGQHFADGLDIGDEVLRQVIRSLYPPVCPYDFCAIPVSVLGKVYENCLGMRLEVEDGAVTLTPKPEVRKAGGVFYTPEWIARYIVDETLGRKLGGKTPADLDEITALDMASGCGAFAVHLADELFGFCEEYYARYPEAIGGRDTEFPDAYRLDDGTIKLSVQKKAQLIRDSIYCLDVDPKAVEITIMWLYVLMLQREGSPIVTEERTYRIPTRVWPEKIAKFALPTLKQNVVCANALVGPDFSEDPAERKRVRAFDWRKDSPRIAAILAGGGFDVCVGNPPYMSSLDMKRVIPKQYEYLRSHYATMSTGYPDLCYGFIEKGIGLLEEDGYLGYIVSNRFIYTLAGRRLRELITSGGILNALIDFPTSDVFEDVTVYPAIVILHRGQNPAFKYAKVRDVSQPQQVLNHLAEPGHEDDALYVRMVEAKELDRPVWGFPAPRDVPIFKALMKGQTRLGDIAEAFAGIDTGANEVFVVTVLERTPKTALIQSRATGQSHRIEAAALQPAIRTRDVERYCRLESKVWVIWPYDDEQNVIPEDELKAAWSLTYAYLLENRNALEARNPRDMEGILWYELLRPRSSELMRSPKLVTGWSADKNRLGIDVHGQFLLIRSNVGIVPKEGAPSLPALLGVLNSSAVKLYLDTISPQYEGGFPTPPGVMDTVPIVPLTEQSKPLYDAIEGRVNAILALQARTETEQTVQQQTDLERQIDALVEELYGVHRP